MEREQCILCWAVSTDVAGHSSRVPLRWNFDTSYSSIPSCLCDGKNEFLIISACLLILWKNKRIFSFIMMDNKTQRKTGSMSWLEAGYISYSRVVVTCNNAIWCKLWCHVSQVCVIYGAWIQACRDNINVMFTRNPKNKWGKEPLYIALLTEIRVFEFSAECGYLTEILTYFEWKAPGHCYCISVISDLVVITHVN